ncbi:hypothetical protein GCM10009530_17840 [Microbispora corallina]|uniref:Integral membrane protein n=1 Tax=Microbispora corallina TaxID=83302 RepID=A0ABQ4FY70_9ACTN|nr:MULTISPECIES: hypothetical protein [Microbispora]ETK33910.1 membrane protein [Microbispora sp. ATCC PTA-5024]GIH39743.1 hypothetical protein Mco01_27430 [Microbispora corallina]
MSDWFHERIVDTHRLPLFCFFVALIVAFLCTRVNVRLIRARARWFGNVNVGETHIHHVVFGVVLMLLGGVAGLVLSGVSTGWYSFTAAVFGVGSALVLDEFALILHLRDVYWQEEGRTSVDAVFVALAATGLLLLGMRPLGWDGQPTGGRWTAVAFLVVNLVFAVVTLLKGKIWSGIAGLFFPPCLYVGAVRLARPGSPWARWYYSEVARRPKPRRMARAVHREERWRRPVIRVKIAVQEFVSGRHDLPAPQPRAYRRRQGAPRHPRLAAARVERRWRSHRSRIR